MQVFKTDKKLLWINELKSWLWTFAFAALVYFGLTYFSSLTSNVITIGIDVIVLLKIADSLTQYHVSEIQIDGENKLMAVILNSKMSGEKIKKYELGQVTSELIINSGPRRYLSSAFILKVFIKPKDTFVISNRYGFTSATLTSVDNILRSIGGNQSNS